MASRETSGVTWRTGPDGVVVSADTYRLLVCHDRARALLAGRDGIRWLELALVGDAHRSDGRDESYDVQPPRVVQHQGWVEVVVGATSPAWASKTIRLACHRDRVELCVHVTQAPGAVPAALSQVTLLGGRAVLESGASGTFRTAAHFAAYFGPTPTEPVQVVRPAGIPSTLGVVGDAGPGRLNAVFSPPPLCWALGRTLPTSAVDVPSGPWIGMSLEAPVEQLTFTTAADFTQRAPSGESLRATAGPWGIAGVHALLGALHRAAKDAKPDALLVTQTPHPSFADVCDMVRLNDVLERAPDGSRVDVVDQLRFRAAVARAALPGHLVDTDQWPMPSRDQWRAYVAEQALLGVPALYYVEGIDTSGELLTREDLMAVALSWARYEAGRTGGTAA